jgi:hypothetical protein
MVVIEVNSCPSGQKSMPICDANQIERGYKILIEETFSRMVQEGELSKGGLAVIYDKNPMETSGYATVMANYFNEPVYLVPFPDGQSNPCVRFQDGIMEIKRFNDEWYPIRAAFKYLTQRPWNRIPIQTRTVILNPIIACLAGGRNKLMAAKAYENYNFQLSGTGMKIKTPETICNVTLEEIPTLVNKWGGHAVVKIPYANAGQGVFTITNSIEMENFLNIDHRYKRFIVQKLIGHSNWSNYNSRNELFHVGSVPDRFNNIYALDFRMMISAGSNGFRPIAVYARQARLPLANTLSENISSWDMLGTNLSIKREDGGWNLDTNRLLTMDEKKFAKTGIGLDSLIDGMIQTILATIAIDSMAEKLVDKNNNFSLTLFKNINNDSALINEILN